MIFFTYIELHGASAQDYDALNDAMAVSGFSTTARSEEKTTYRLPRGMYRCQSDKPANAILDIAREIANSTGFPNEIITIPTRGARWYPQKS